MQLDAIHLKNVKPGGNAVEQTTTKTGKNKGSNPKKGQEVDPVVKEQFRNRERKK